jgi:hypothetical protein
VRIEYPYYPWALPVEVPDHLWVGTLEPQLSAQHCDASTLIERALDNPIGTPPLTDLLGRSRRVVILIDDNTRWTPGHLILPPVLTQMEKAGIIREQILILVGYGTHRPMTDAERRQKLGRSSIYLKTVTCRFHRLAAENALPHTGYRLPAQDLHFEDRRGQGAHGRLAYAGFCTAGKSTHGPGSPEANDCRVA